MHDGRGALSVQFNGEFPSSASRSKKLAGVPDPPLAVLAVENSTPSSGNSADGVSVTTIRRIPTQIH